METTMHTRKVTNKFKIAAAGVLSAAIVASGGYVVGSQGTPTVSADSSQATTDASKGYWHGTEDKQAALIVSATDYYVAQKEAEATGTPYVPQKSYDLQIEGANARLKLSNSDSGSVAYLHYAADSDTRDGDNGQWNVVYGGQTPVSSTVASQYGMPSDWANDLAW